jgi:hypothetical protein
MFATLHFCIGASAQSSIIEGFTIFGPTIAIAMLFLMSLLFASRGPEDEATATGGGGGGGGGAVTNPVQAIAAIMAMLGFQ